MRGLSFFLQINSLFFFNKKPVVYKMVPIFYKLQEMVVFNRYDYTDIAKNIHPWLENKLMSSNIP